MDADEQDAVPELLSQGSEALSRGAWEDARASFRAACQLAPLPEAFEGLGLACWWLDDAAGTFEARERAYGLYRGRGDRRGAARVAATLADDSLDFRGEPAVSNGWRRRAHRLLEGLGRTPEHGWLAAAEAHYALLMDDDTARTRRLAEEAVELGRALGVVDIEMLGLALEGLALVSEGAVEAGMARLDEATTAALNGEMTELIAIGVVCCYLIFACERVRDVDRAAQWCERVKEFSRRWRFGTLFAVCRAHYATVLLWRGDWAAAEHELVAATDELAATRPGMAAEGAVRLADLRRLQGRFAEAEELFEQSEGHSLALLGRAALALDRDDPQEAVDLAERFLRHVPAENRTVRVAGLELLVRASLGLGRAERAATALAELEATTRGVATVLMSATAAFARGLVALHTGDYDLARRQLEDAVDLFERGRVPYEAARARAALARCLHVLGRAQAAEREAARARAALRDMGAGHQAARLAVSWGAAATRAPSDAAGHQDGAGLTPREHEVLRLIAAGRSNQEIAAELVLSVRTVERHISTIYEKIGATGRIARAAATAYALRSGLAESH